MSNLASTFRLNDLPLPGGPQHTKYTAQMVKTILTGFHFFLDWLAANCADEARTSLFRDFLCLLAMNNSLL